MSYRDYLADASFTVGLESEDRDLLERNRRGAPQPDVDFVPRPQGVSPSCPAPRLYRLPEGRNFERSTFSRVNPISV